MRKSDEREILRKIREEESSNVLDFTDDGMSIRVTIKENKSRYIVCTKVSQ